MVRRKDAPTAPLIERAIAVVSPSWAASRSEARLAAQVGWIRESAARGYDAAAMSRRTKGWMTSSGSAATVIGAGLDRLRDRSRDLARNNEWVAKALAVIEDDVVGVGFTVKFEHKDKGRAQAVADLWAEWADSLQIDTAGLQDFSGLLALATRSMAESGEVLLRRRWRKAEDGLSVPLQFQLLECDHLDTMKDGLLSGGGRIIQGVEFDALGRRAAYWLFREHPGDPLPSTRESVRVPASEIIHLFREDRRGAVRGVPWGAPCLMRLRMLQDWDDTKLERKRLANKFVGAIELAESVKPTAELGEDGQIYEQVEDWKPGMVQYLNPGEKMTWNDPPEDGEDHEAYYRVGLLAVAAGFQVPYEALTGDLRNTSFSSGRLGWLQWQRRIESIRWRILIPRACKPAVSWFLEALAVKDPGMLTVKVTFDPPHREMIDPVAEVNAFEKAMRLGIASRPGICRRLGEDAAQILDETSTDNKAQAEKGVMFSGNPANDLGRKPAGDPGRKPGQAANQPA